MSAFWASLFTPIGALLAALAAFTTFYLVYWWSAVTKAKPKSIKMADQVDTQGQCR